jgi:predicted nucleic acid-binding protein
VVDLDTSFLIEAMHPDTAEAVLLAGWLAAGETVEVSAVAWGEFLCGPLLENHEETARRMLPDVRAFDKIDAERAAELFNLSGRRSKSYADCCIAACAIRAGARLATSNEDDFKRMLPHGLQLA